MKMLLIDKQAKSLNFEFIDKQKFPAEYDNSNVREDFELLFQQTFDPNRLKELLRRTQRDPNQAIRKYLWKRILLPDNAQAQITIDKYNKKINVLFGKNLQLNAEMPDFIESDQLAFYYLNEEGKAAVCRILNVLASAHPDITYAPLLLPLTSLFLHYMSEPECYACLLAVVESKNVMITQTDIHWTTTNLVFRRFAQKYSRTSYQYVLNALYSKTKDSDAALRALDNWQWWMFRHLPFNYVLNIIDCFLLEGQKVLYRYGICLLEFFYKSLSSNQNRPDSLDLDAIDNFCTKITIPQEALFKAAFGLRNMRRRDLEIVFQAEEKSIKKIRAKSNAKTAATLNFSNASGLNFVDSNKQLQLAPTTTTTTTPNSKKFKLKNNNDGEYYSCSIIPKRKSSSHIVSDEKENIVIAASASTAAIGAENQKHNSQAVADSNNNNPRLMKWHSALKTIGISKKWKVNSSKALQSHLSYHHHHPHQSHLNLPAFSLENIGSSILTPQQIAQIWRWLPTRYQILELQVIYSTNIHGCRMMTLFDKIEFYQATVIIVQTMRGAIFGAFCSQPWSQRDNTRFRRPAFFGNGESFLFELRPDVKMYEWVGKVKNGNTTANQELFQYADSTKLIVGGGNTTTRFSVNSLGQAAKKIIKFTMSEEDDEDDAKKENNLQPDNSEEVKEEQIRGMGLSIDADLLRGRSAVSDTFENEVLGEEPDFEIACLEVFGFQGGLNNF